ncbi:hypothetical protein CY34DRAFT_493010 [Suillus luteus UH-Slu-Lm8-n1]|uniref:Uncharacterized protein n=1 Tax=Suillus luteus UH-Slu-Lm8-n1 TaxID=930992 RepID=A0A0D0AY26_9AGAM|nr:hypothetical protein CY34DRAFT_493010 [Suillus luteus UH-Slu-Lm8-n1]
MHNFILQPQLQAVSDLGKQGNSTDSDPALTSPESGHDSYWMKLFLFIEGFLCSRSCPTLTMCLHQRAGRIELSSREHTLQRQRLGRISHAELGPLLACVGLLARLPEYVPARVDVSHRR